MSLHNSLRSRISFQTSKTTANVARAKARKAVKRKERRIAEEWEAISRKISVAQLRKEKYREAERNRNENHPIPSFSSYRDDYHRYRW